MENRAEETPGRSDDTKSIQKERIKVYFKETQPMVDFYKKKGMLTEIDATKDIEDVSKLT